VDPWFLVEAAPETARLVRTAREINDEQPAFIAKLIEQTAGGLSGKAIAFLGLAFKPNVDDLRESPAVELAHALEARGAKVLAYEPYKPQAGLPGIHQVDTLAEALAEADLIVQAVAHDQFKSLDPAEIAQQTPAKIAFDAVNTWDKAKWEAAGFQFTGLARKY
jgi:UDP-N-acetyl-D-mannosaminuronic acid dehydrogenase